MLLHISMLLDCAITTFLVNFSHQKTCYMTSPWPSIRMAELRRAIIVNMSHGNLYPRLEDQRHLYKEYCIKIDIRPSLLWNRAKGFIILLFDNIFCPALKSVWFTMFLSNMCDVEDKCYVRVAFRAYHAYSNVDCEITYDL